MKLAQKESSIGCQQRVDIKAFKGKGTRKVQDALSFVQSEMSKLARKTKDVSGRLFFLEVHRRTSTCQMSLKWRLAYGRWRHANWDDEELQSYLSRMSVDWVDWYSDIAKKAVLLNAEEKKLRMQLRGEAT